MILDCKDDNISMLKSDNLFFLLDTITKEPIYL